MATILYKDGVKIRVEADQVQNKLADGYSVINEQVEAYTSPPPEISQSTKRGRKPCSK
jgi:hypothetical protein